MPSSGLRRWQAERRQAIAEAADHDRDLVGLAAQQKMLAGLRAIHAKSALRRAATAARRAARLQRTPPWADLGAIRQLHEDAQRLTRDTGVQHQVDHVLPLRGRLVSGLHVHTNMRVIPARDNVAKGNRFEVSE